MTSETRRSIGAGDALTESDLALGRTIWFGIVVGVSFSYWFALSTMSAYR